jgi:hypothetical protein
VENLRNAKPISEKDREEFALGVALMHYSMNTGIKKFETKGKAGVTKELAQMHNMSVFRPIKVVSLTYNERKKALLSLMFLKEKRDSSVKVHMCADGRKQKGWHLVKTRDYVAGGGNGVGVHHCRY